jgi:hypothetical protein
MPKMVNVCREHQLNCSWKYQLPNIIKMGG